jgi:hypothetical protein
VVSSVDAAAADLGTVADVGTVVDVEGVAVGVTVIVVVVCVTDTSSVEETLAGEAEVVEEEAASVVDSLSASTVAGEAAAVPFPVPVAAGAGAGAPLGGTVNPPGYMVFGIPARTESSLVEADTHDERCTPIQGGQGVAMARPARAAKRTKLECIVMAKSNWKICLRTKRLIS